MSKEVLVCRKFEILNSTNQVIQHFELIIFKPIQIGEDWVCRYFISDAPLRPQKEIFGIDSFQALSLAIKLAKAEIEGLSRYSKITFLEDDDLWL